MQAHTEDLLLGIDIGTQGVKGAIVSLDGKIVAEAFLEHSCRYPRVGWVEHDMTQNWWQNPCWVIRKMLAESGVNPAQIKAVFPSGLHPNFGPTDECGKPVYGAILYSDNRAVEELNEINQRYNLKLTSEEMTPKLVWFLRNEKQAAARMRRFFDAAQYFVYKLCGEYITDTISVGGWGAIYHSPTNCWKEEVCEQLGIDPEILPKIVPPLTIVGDLHAEAAKETGLMKGTLVAAGTNDVTASTISGGATTTSEAIAYYGTAGLLPVMKVDMAVALRQPYPYEEKGLRPQDGYLYDYPAYCLTTGDSLRWFRDEFGYEQRIIESQTGISAYAQFDQLAENAPPTCDGLIFIPHMLGQRSPQFNPYASGAFIGLRRFHTRSHLFRALLEAWGYTIRYGLESYYPSGHPLKRLIATGGGARSQLWRQIVTDITRIPQEHAPNAEGSIADAYLAGMAIGYFADFETLLSKWLSPGEVILPRPEQSEIYQQGYENFVKVHEILEPLFHLNQKGTSRKE